jgi:Beta-carotene isomerase D27-like, C-terminal
MRASCDISSTTMRCQSVALLNVAELLLLLLAHESKVHGLTSRIGVGKYRVFTTTTRLEVRADDNGNDRLEDVSQRSLLAEGKERLLSIKWDDIGSMLLEEAKDVSKSVALAFTPVFQSDSSTSAQDILQICDELDALESGTATVDGSSGAARQDGGTAGSQSPTSAALRRQALKYARYELLAKLMRSDYSSYVATAIYLSPSRIPRCELPNVQDIPYHQNTNGATASASSAMLDERGQPLVPDCTLSNMAYQENLLDQLLLSIFRKLVTQHTGGVTSKIPGILGLLEQGRTFMLQPNQTAEAQHTMVQNTLSGLMTPVLPPFYRIFMAGMVPSAVPVIGGRQFGPWFYAPFLTALVTPTFFGFLVGPSRPNRRQDGQHGGLVVEKCKFLQESGCKGLCLHQCKLPAQQFFADTLGVPLTVTPNFVTQECQWSFGQVPVPVADDPSFPKGCLTGCASRQAVNEMQPFGQSSFVDLCN